MIVCWMIMDSTVLTVVVVLVLLGALLVIPLGLPGLWIMVVVLLAAVHAGTVSWTTWGILAGLALVSEVVEFGLLKVFGERYGGSGKAFWGAVVGGGVGAVTGAPVPVVGPIVAALLGTFAGAGIVTYVETRSVRSASRVGWGVVLARTLSVGLKIGVGIVVLVVGAGALLLG